MPPGASTLLLLFAAGWTALTCLRVLAAYFENSLRWHNLKVEAHQLRRKQVRRLHRISQRRASTARPEPIAQFDVDVLSDEAIAA